MGGLDEPTSGDVRFGGVSLFRGFGAAGRRTRLRATRMGFVFQSFHLMSELDIVENVMLPTMTGCVGRSGARDRAQGLLERVGLSDRLNHLPTELSGGEQQRVALARALVNSPSLIIADEPTGNIDPELSFEIVDLLNEINKLGVTIVMVTHEHDLVQQFNRRVITIEKGEVIRDVEGTEAPVC